MADQGWVDGWDEPMATPKTQTSVWKDGWDEPTKATSAQPQPKKSYEGKLVDDAKSITEGLFPGVKITDWVRDPNSALGRANPDSYHNHTKAAIDMAPIPGMTFQQVADAYKAKGYDLVEALDEVSHPKPWTTGPNWHFTLGGGPQVDTPQVDTPQVDTPKVNTPQPQAQPAPQQGWQDGWDSKPAPQVPETYTGPQELRPTAVIQDDNTDNLAENERRDNGISKYRDQIQADLFTLAKQKGVTADQAWETINQQVPGILLPNQKANFDWYFKHYQEGGRTPISWTSQGEAPQTTVEGVDDRSGLRKNIDNARDMAMAVKHKFEAAPVHVAEFGLGLSDWLGVTDGKAQELRDTEDELSNSSLGYDYNNPEGLPATIGGMIGEGIATAPMFELNPVSKAVGVESKLLDNMGSGALMGMTMDRGEHPLEAAAMGAATVGAFEGAGKLLSKGATILKESGKFGDLTRVVSDNPKATIQDIQPDAGPKDGYVRVYHGGSSDGPGEWFSTNKDYAKGYADRSEKPQVWYTDLPRDDPRVSTDIEGQGPDKGFTFNGKLTPEEINGLRPARDAAEALPSIAESTRAANNRAVNEVKAKVDEITKDWENSPNFNIIAHTDALTKEQKAQIKADGAKLKDVQAFVDKDGTVHIIANQLKNVDQVKAIVYHEALGHKGLGNVFQDTLDPLLDDLYAKNWKVRRAADAYIEENPNVYLPKLKKGETHTEADIAKQRTRATEEVLANLSENGQLKLSQWEKIKAAVTKFGRERLGIDMRYSDTEVKAILAKAHDNIVNGGDVSTASSGNRYSMRSKDVQDVVDRVRATEDMGKMTHEEALNEMRLNGFTPSRAMKKSLKLDPTLAPRIIQARDEALNKSLANQDKVLSGKATPAQAADYKIQMLKALELTAKVERFRADIGRALNFLKLVADGKENPLNVPKELLNDPLFQNLDNPQNLYKLAQMMSEFQANPAAKTRIIKDLAKPRWEDKVTDFHYAMMLSGLGTHSKNILGNAGLIVADNIAHTMAAVGGLGKMALGDADRVTMTEAAGRWWGIMRALKDAQTYQDVATSWKEGHPHHQVSKAETGNVLPGILGAPQRGLAAEDSFFRSIIQNSDYQGMAIRVAQKEGKKGAEFWDRVDELIQNPTPAMEKRADARAANLQLVEDPSRVGKWIEQGKARAQKSDDYFGRTRSFVIRNLLPFTRVSTNLIEMAFQYSPAGALLSRAGRAAWKAGGAERDVQIARMLMGSAVGGYFYNLASQGALRINELTHIPEVLTKDGWMSMAGMDAVSTHAGMAYALFDAINNKGDEQDAAQMAGNILQHSLSGLAGSSVVSQLTQLFDIVEPGPQGESAFKKFIQRQATSWSPALLRGVNSSLKDEVVRDSSNGIMDKYKAGIPGMSQELPARRDAYGREMQKNQNLFGIGNTEPLETDKTIAEMQRLAQTVNKGKDLFEAPRDVPQKVEDYFKTQGRTITAEDRETYAYYVGVERKKRLDEFTQSKAYQNATDEQKVKFARKISDQAASYVRKTLYGLKQ